MAVLALLFFAVMAAPLPAAVTLLPASPEFHEAGYYGDYARVAIPCAEGVTYRVNGGEVWAGDYYFFPGDTVTVTAIPDSAGNYSFPAGAVTEWTHTFARVEVTPSGTWSPEGLPQYGALTAAAHLNAVFVNLHDGEPIYGAVSYNIIENGVPGRELAPGMTLPPGEHAVRATLHASDDYGGAHVDAALVVTPMIGLIPASPAFVDIDGSDGYVIIPSVPGVVYKTYGIALSAGEYAFGEDGYAEVTAEAAPGHVFINGSATVWPYFLGSTDTATLFDTPAFIEAGGGEERARVVLPDLPGVVYKINSHGEVPAGTHYFDHDAYVHVTADGIRPYAFGSSPSIDPDNIPGGSWTHTFGGEHERLVTPDAPECTGDGWYATVVIPFTPGVIYKVNDKVVDAEVRDLVVLAGGHTFDYDNCSGHLDVTAEAAPGYEIADGAVARWELGFYGPAPEAPVFHEAGDGGGARVTIPAPEEFFCYCLNGEMAGEGDYYFSPGDTVTVTAEPWEGFYFPVTEWTHTFAGGPVTPGDPGFIEPAYDDANASVVIPNAGNAIYYIDGMEAMSGDQYYFAFGETITISVMRTDNGSTFEWTHTFNGSGGGAPLHPASVDGPPDFRDYIASVHIPYVDGACYYINGNAAGEGDYPFSFGETITVTLAPWFEYYLPSGVATAWTHTFIPASPPAPGFHMDDDYAYVSFPWTDGIFSYRIEGSGGSWGGIWEGEWYCSDGETVTVTAEPAEGYQFAPGVVTQWTHTFDRQAITPWEPSYYDGGVSIPWVENVIYRINGVEVMDGDHGFGVGETITVTAEAADGYHFSPGAVTEWTHTFADPYQIAPPAPSFDDSGVMVYLSGPDCATYRINGVEAWEGEFCFSLGETVTVTAEATNGYYFAPGAVTTWTHTFVVPNGKFTPAGRWAPASLPQSSGLAASAHLNAVFINPATGAPVPGSVAYYLVEDGVIVQTLAPGMTLPPGTHTVRARLPASQDHNTAYVDATLAVAASNPNGGDAIPDSIKTGLGLNPSSPNNAPAATLEVNLHTPVR